MDLKGVAMICFYWEQNGDFLAIDTSTNAYYMDIFGKDQFRRKSHGHCRAGRLGLHDRHFQKIPARELQTCSQSQGAEGVA